MSAASSALNKRVLLPAGIVAVLAVITLAVPLKGLTSSLQSHNLLALIGNLGGTTGSMLRNTQALHTKVQYVEGELGQLNTQESILRQQLVTGNQLRQQLATQETLTGTDVQLMQQILSRQQQSVSLTGQVAAQAKELSSSVSQNVQQLNYLAGSLQTASAESSTLNQQMSQLLYQLDEATLEFRLFGQVDNLLSGAGGLLGTGPSSKSGFSSLLSSVPLLGSPSGNSARSKSGSHSSGSGSGTGSKSNSGSGSNSNLGSSTSSSSGLLAPVGSLIGSLP